MLPSSHLDILELQNYLARAYICNNGMDKAIALLEDVVIIQKETLSPEHPMLLMSMNNLAEGYAQNYWPDKALTHRLQGWRVASKVYTEEHPLRLAWIRKLGITYMLNLDSMAPLSSIEGTVQKMERVLHQDHPNLLSA
jgi:hypothetical protein